MQFGILTVKTRSREDVLIIWRNYLSCSFVDVSLASKYNDDERAYNGYTYQVAAVSNPETVHRADEDMFVPQEIFQNESSGQIPETIDFNMPALAEGVDMDNYLTSDLELGQFFVPDEFERWVHGGASRHISAG